VSGSGQTAPSFEIIAEAWSFWERAMSVEGPQIAQSDRRTNLDEKTFAWPVMGHDAAAAFVLGQLQGCAHALFKDFPVAIYTTDAEGSITSFNEAAVVLWGVRPELGKSEYCGSYRLYWPDGTPLPHDHCPMAMTLREGKSIRGMEVVSERPDGTRVALISYPTPVFDGLGELIGAVNVIVDITERKRTEESLGKRREELDALYRFTDRLFRAESPSDVYESALDAITRSLGCRRAAVLVFDDAGIMRFVAWRGLSDDYRRAVEGHSPWVRDARNPQPLCIENVETTDFPEHLKAVVRAEGIAACAFIPLIANGNLIGKFMTYYDTPHAFGDPEVDLAVTIARQLGFGVERMRADQSRRLESTIVLTSNDAIISRDLNGIITSWNNGAERIFGHAASEMIGSPITRLIPKDRRYEELHILGRVWRGERVDHYETVRRRKDGSLVDVSLTVSPLKDSSGKIVGASKIARDITERRRSEEQIANLAREAEHRAKNVLATVQATVHLSEADTPDRLKDVIAGRIQALANVHALFVQARWTGAELRSLIEQELAPYSRDNEARVRIEGPAMSLEPKKGQTIAMSLHELATNAAKYGALSIADGVVHVAWSQPAVGQFMLHWTETGGPLVDPPTRRGFGINVIVKMVRQLKGDVHFDWRTEGLSCKITIPV
jgi:PAS domain S-box-containing protein